MKKIVLIFVITTLIFPLIATTLSFGYNNPVKENTINFIDGTKENKVEKTEEVKKDEKQDKEESTEEDDEQRKEESSDLKKEESKTEQVNKTEQTNKVEQIEENETKKEEENIKETNISLEKEKIEGAKTEETPIEETTEENGIATFSMEKSSNRSVIEEGVYYIRPAIKSNMVFDITGASQSNSAKLQLWEKSAQATDNQKFEIKSVGNGYYSIQAKHSGKVLDVVGAGKANQTKVQQYTSNGSYAQQWYMEYAGNGYFNIVSRCNGLYLDIPGASAKNGTIMQVYEGNGSKAQQFELQKIAEIPTKTIDNGIYKIKTASNSKLGLDIANMSNGNGTNVQLWTESNIVSKNQRFQITYKENGYYEILAQHSQKSLDVAGAGMTNGTNICQYQSNGTDAQRWIIKENGDGTYSIVSKLNGLYLDVAGAMIKDGGNIQVYQGNGSPAQKFKFEKVEKATCKKLVEDGIYKINTALNANSYLDIAEGSNKNSANLQIWSKNTLQQQKFQITYQSQGYYEIKSVNSAKVLDVAGGSDKNGTNVRQYEANNTESQKWILQDAGNGYYYIMSRGAEAYLDVAGASSRDGTNVQIYAGNQTNSQKFRFEEVQALNNDEYEIAIAKNTNMVLDIDEASSNLQIWECNHASNNQKFQLEYLGQGYYKITCKKTGKVLTVGTNNNVGQADYTNSDKQKWRIEIGKEGYFLVKSKATGLYLDVAGGASSNGTNIHVYTGNGTTAQMFKFAISQNNNTSNFWNIDEAKYPGYKSLLEQVQKQHPNWSIHLYYTGLDWNTAVTEEDTFSGESPKNLTQSPYLNEWKVGNETYDVSRSWYRASREAIAYMMDPRNSLEEHIFQFQDLSSSSGTRNEIEKAVAGTFLNNTSDVDAILSTAQKQGISPFHLISRIIKEQGVDGKGVMNGYYYEEKKATVYNLFNIGVSGNSSEGIKKGAAYAYAKQWFTRKASIEGGAEFLKVNYINKGQCTLYYQKYNVVNKTNLYGNQYMQNIRAANDEGKDIYDAYQKNGMLDSHFTFVIPVYENMPKTPCPRPAQ